MHPFRHGLMGVIALILALPAQARPVSYAGGTMLMLTHDPDASSLRLDYSPTARYAVGYRHEYFRDTSTHMDAITINYLAKRWNNPASQGNFYLLSGIGAAYDKHDIDPAGWLGLSADWEDRRYFTSYETKAFYGGGDQGVADNFVEHTARVGIAPYIGDSGDVHTWLMMETRYDAGDDDPFSVTPLVRAFKGSTLIEAGYRIDDGMVLNFTHTF
ncbi:MAG: hypothetical protein J0L77_09840 [Alphaproteobacteria bacterium]|nr:hypothetical protein [Alphaproteobacteria bacterium]